MSERAYTPELCVAAAEIDRALALMIAVNPPDLPEFSERIQTAAVQLNKIKALGDLQPELLEIRKKLDLLNSLFLNAESFYSGWAALAGVAEVDRSRGSVSVQG